MNLTVRRKGGLSILLANTSVKLPALCGRCPELFSIFWSGIFLLTFFDVSDAAGTWIPLTQTAPESINTMLLLPDGTVMAAGGSDNTWYRLTPDNQGSYVNGTWSTLASMHDTRLYFSSDVLTNGRVFVAGAEYGTGTNSAEVYDPLSDTWTMAPPPPAGQNLFYDSISKILPNGNVLVAPVNPATYGGTVIYVAASNSWASGPTLYRGYYQDEASWVKLPDDSILTIDPFGTNSERYIPSLNQWINDAGVPVEVYDPYGSEMGAGFLLPDGRAFFLGATGNTAFYTPSGNTNMGAWQAGPVIPNGQGTPDAPAAMMVNGNILCAVSPTPISSDHFPSPTSFYEFDPVANSFNQVNGPTGLTFGSSTYILRMLDLPDGNVLLSTSGSQLYIYEPSGAPLAAGKPAILDISTNNDGSFHLTGTLLNGISEGAAYGDDAQMDSNYPLVRLTNSLSGNVYYARTFGWNSTGVMPGNAIVSTEFALPAGLPAGDYSLVAVANGISSDPVPFSIVTPPYPVIVLQPSNQTARIGTDATFTVGATGSNTLSYFWMRGNSFIDAATNSSHTITNVQLSDSGAQFSCLVSNAFGTALSSNATLTVSASIVQNGGFETGNFSFWSTGGNFVYTSVVNSSPDVHSGHYGARLGPPGSLGYISQVLPTTADQSYLVSCWLYSNGQTPNEFLISWNGATLFDQINIGNTGWTNIQLVATATTGSTTLQFGFQNDPDYLGLDDIAVIPVEPPLIQNVTKSGGAVHFTWNTVAGLSYQIQFATNLIQPDWINLGSATVASGSTLSATDSVGPDAQRFYRIIRTP
jgi:hypothetical protein